MKSSKLHFRILLLDLKKSTAENYQTLLEPFGAAVLLKLEDNELQDLLDENLAQKLSQELSKPSKKFRNKFINYLQPSTCDVKDSTGGVNGYNTNWLKMPLRTLLTSLGCQAEQEKFSGAYYVWRGKVDLVMYIHFS